MYKQKTENDQSAGYVNAALDFKLLEKYCMNYIEQPGPPPDPAPGTASSYSIH